MLKKLNEKKNNEEVSEQKSIILKHFRTLGIYRTRHDYIKSTNCMASFDRY